MAKELWSEITAQERSIILKHLQEQYEGTCELCGKDSEEAGEAKAVYKKVLSKPLKDCWSDIENFYSEVMDAIRIGLDPDNDMARMGKKVLGFTDESLQRLDGGFNEMKSVTKIRKENYERGLKDGNKIHCGQDLKDLIGFRVSDVTSDENDMDVIMWLEDENGMISVYFDNLCFDGESMSMVEHTGEKCESILRPVSESDLKEISGMVSYYDNELYDECDELVGVNHLYCNDIKLEGTEHFKIKNLYIFKDGRIMTAE